ncbi:MAG TPA: hypothetical protein VEE82_01840 [Thermodesulfovibrionales bacterium]|nr:hypothetical protein [Thermodesulfovibrionales bacterium]
MNEKDKLRHLLHHWMEHNLEHAEVYREWAAKASALGDKELSEILDTLYAETKKLNGLFEAALKRI